MPLLLLLTACLDELPEPAGDPCGAWAAPGAYEFTYEHDGKIRRSRVYVPAGEGPRTLVINLHGASHSGAVQRALSGYEDYAQREAFVVLHPNGTGALKTWNGGKCCGAGVRKQIDDVGYLEGVAAELSERLCVDRVIATGFSNGGLMTYRWACQGDWVDGAVVVAGSLEVDGCEDGRPIPLMHWHGTADEQVLYDGGVGAESSVQLNFRGAPGSVEVWRERNACGGEDPRLEVLSDVTCQHWEDCAAPVSLCTVAQGGHTWPGGNAISGESGYIAQGADATEDGYSWVRSALDTLGGDAAENQGAR